MNFASALSRPHHRHLVQLADGSRQQWTLIGASTAVFVVGLDYYGLSIALPTIQRAFNASSSSLTWILNAYLLAFTAGLIAAGRLADLYGRRRILIAGMAIFAFASAFGASSQSIGWMITARAIQGVGAAAMFPASLAVVENAFPVEKRAGAIGSWVGINGVGMAFGPVVGGILVQRFGWPLVFLLNVPVLLLGIAIIVWSVLESRDEQAVRHFDLAGLATVTPGLVLLTLALDQGGIWGWTSPRVIGLLLIAVLLLLIFGVLEGRVLGPLVELGLFRNVAFVGAASTAFLGQFAVGALIFFYTLYLQNVLHYSPLVAGLLFVPQSALLMIAGPAAGRLATRFGYRRPITIAGIVLAISCGLLAGPAVGRGWEAIVPCFILFGIGFGIAYTIATTAAVNAVPESKAGIASGVNGMIVVLGVVTGVAVTHAVFLALQHARLSQLATASPAAQADAFTAALSGVMWLVTAVTTAAILTSATMIARFPAQPAAADAK
ncbi:MAG: MFS transporter [Chloroflexota bacterium]